MVITILLEPGVPITRIETEENQNKTLLMLLREQRVYVDAPCNGKGSCGKCLVQYLSGAPEAGEREIEKLSETEIKKGWRLACLSVPKGDCEVCLHLQKEKNMAVETAFSCGEKSADGEFGQTYSQSTRVDEYLKEKGTQTYNDEYGVALDIGTTTLAALLFRLPEGENLQTAVSVNHQRAYGADVISRIKAANEGNGRVLQNIIRKDILGLLEELVRKEKIRKEQIKHLIVVGNTTMCHLLLGYSCEKLGKTPFTPVDISLQKKSFQQIFDSEEYETEITVLPGISAFVGADIVSGIYSTGMCEGKESRMLLDLGTNGEMALYADGRLTVTSVAAGPALEGGNISCGMPGVPGAIAHAALFGKERMIVKTIGKQPPEGLCGTGIVDVVYELLKHHLIDENGILAEPYFAQGYPVVPGKVFFTQEDIRQVQMAKAAVCAGIELLLHHAGMEVWQVKEIFVAGGFGFALDVQKSIGIGLLPKAFRGKVTAVGNSALEGARRYLTEPDAGRSMTEMMEHTEEINLAMQKGFEEAYLKEMQFNTIF